MAASCDQLQLKSYAVKVDVERQLTQPQGLSFQSILFVTQESGGVLSATNRTHTVYGADEVLELWGVNSEAYRAALAAFSQVVAPTYIKIGFADAGETLLQAVTAIHDNDCNFYGFACSNVWRDDAGEIVPVIQWAATERKIFSVTTNDPNTKSTNLSDACLAKTAQDLDVENFVMNYSSHASVYPCVAQLAVDLVVNLDNPNSYATSKFKYHATIPAEQLSGAEYTAITGFVPGDGYSTTAGRYCNVMVNTQTPMYAEGIAGNGEFIDRVIYRHWLEQSIEISKFTELKTNPAIPQSDAGYMQMVAAIVRVIKRAQANGGLLETIEDADGKQREGYVIDWVRRADVNPTNIANRIMPEIKVKVYYSDAVHYSSTRVQGAL